MFVMERRDHTFRLKIKHECEEVGKKKKPVLGLKRNTNPRDLRLLLEDRKTILLWPSTYESDLKFRVNH